MNSKIKPDYLLKIFIAISIIATFIHNVDNYVRFDHYPQPDWITPFGIIRSWIVWTIFGIAGYWLYKNQQFGLAYLCLIVYSSCGLSSLGHYLYGRADEFSATMHFFILADGLAGFAVLGFALWSGLILRERFRKQPAELSGGTAITIFWEYQVNMGCESEFERVYGSDGDWVELFKQGDGYLGTEIFRDVSVPRHYITIDRWVSKEAYKDFHQKFAQEYGVIDERLDCLTERQALLGYLTLVF